MAEAYSIDGFTAAVDKVVKLREDRLKRKEKRFPNELNDEYRAMFAKMGKFRGGYIKGLGFCLEPEEKGLLAQYLFNEADESEKNTLSSALMEDLESGGAQGLYKQCILHYDDKAYKPLFSLLRTHVGFAKIVEREYGYKPDGAMGAMSEGRAPEYFNGVASMKASSDQNGYFEALKKIGVPEGCKLFDECAQLYVLVCDAKEYKRLGVEELMKNTEGWNEDLKRRLLSNMLVKLDAFQLRAFVPMLKMFISLTGEEGSQKFEKNMAGVSPVNRRKYATWMSQNVIVDVLGHSERAEFWLDYIDRCTVSKHGPSGALILDFGVFKVIEFHSDISAYFYDKEYFDTVVVEGLARTHSEEALDEWLEKKTEWAQQEGENNMHWRKAHKGNWKVDMRNYIATNTAGMTN